MKAHYYFYKTPYSNVNKLYVIFDYTYYYIFDIPTVQCKIYLLYLWYWFETARVIEGIAHSSPWQCARLVAAEHRNNSEDYDVTNKPLHCHTRKWFYCLRTGLAYFQWRRSHDILKINYWVLRRYRFNRTCIFRSKCMCHIQTTNL